LSWFPTGAAIDLQERGFKSRERFVPAYKATSTVDLLMNAPFDE